MISLKRIKVKEVPKIREHQKNPKPKIPPINTPLHLEFVHQTPLNTRERVKRKE